MSPTRSGVTEHTLPLIARLTVHALGAVEGGRVREPVDPVAAWMLAQRDALSPRGIAPAAYSTIRTRTGIFDRCVREELHRFRGRGESVCLWTIGGALDSRWHRLAEDLGDVVVELREVDSSEILAYKDELLAASPWADAWNRVSRRAHPAEGWTVRPRSGARPLVVLESVAGRLPRDAMRRLLGRIRYETPDARVILALPGQAPGEAAPWSTRDLTSLGWTVDEDMGLGARSRLMTPQGGELTPGMYPVRVVTLSGR